MPFSTNIIYGRSPPQSRWLFLCVFVPRMFTRALHGSPMGDPFKNGKPMGTHWVYCKYLFSNQMLSDKKHIAWKLVYFCIDSYKQLFNIEDVSRVIRGFLINPQLECFEISFIFHGLLLRLQKKIEMKIFLNWSQESLEKNSWVPIAMLWCSPIDSDQIWLSFGPVEVLKPFKSML